MLSFLLFDSLIITQSSEVVHWGYDHPELWGLVYPMCNAPDESPINIDTSTADIDENVCTSEFVWSIDYNHTLFKATNNGHSIAVVKIPYILLFAVGIFIFNY